MCLYPCRVSLSLSLSVSLALGDLTEIVSRSCNSLSIYMYICFYVTASISDSHASVLRRGVSDARASLAPAESLTCTNAGFFQCMCAHKPEASCTPRVQAHFAHHVDRPAGAPIVTTCYIRSLRFHDNVCVCVSCFCVYSAERSRAAH